MLREFKSFVTTKKDARGDLDVYMKSKSVFLEL